MMSKQKSVVQERAKGETAVHKPTPQQQQQSATDPVAQLQRTLGNRAVGRLLQRKMALGPVGDKYEQEADAVAKQVMGSLANQQTSQLANQPPTAQRQEDEEELQMKPLPAISAIQRQEEEEELQMKPLAQRQEEEEELQMKPLAQRQEEEELQAKGDPLLEGGTLSGDIESAVQSAKAGGQPLPEATRAPMESAFGADFSGVKIHTDGQADTLNRSLSARAFTTGQDVFFRQGEYNPGSSGGQELLAHELTHVVQQSGNTAQRVIRRVTIGKATKPAPTKDWEVMGGFATKHLVEGALTEEKAKTKWRERWSKPSIRAPKNTVVSQEDLKTAIESGKVEGKYPQERGPRGKLIAKLKGYTVKRKYGTDDPGAVTELSQIGVEGTATGSLFFPDHLDPESSQ
jgi:hypothetical protein